MRNIKLVIEYDGSFFNGFQKQKNPRFTTVQGVLESALCRVLQEPVKTAAAGRTDSGVHAINQVVTFKTVWAGEPESLRRSLNALTGRGIFVKHVSETADMDFHARFSAKSRTYHYHIVNTDRDIALGGAYAYVVRRPLDLDSMRRSARYFLGEQDFTGFSTSVKEAHRTVRHMQKVELYRGAEYLERFGPSSIPMRGDLLEDTILIEIRADGFLRSMVRMMAAVMVRCGLGGCAPEEVRRIIELKDSSLVHTPAPPQALYFFSVEY